MDNFEELVKQYEPMIYKVMHSLNIFTNKDEFYQIGLIALWDASKGFHSEKGDFLNYAYMYVKGRMMTELTRSNRYHEHVLYPKDEFWLMIEDTSFVNRPLELENLLAYCDGLSERERKWVIYHFYYGLKQSQIAPLENVTIHAVQRWRREALKKLRNKLNE